MYVLQSTAQCCVAARVQMTAMGKIVAGVCAVAGISFFALPAVRIALPYPGPHRTGSEGTDRDGTGAAAISFLSHYIAVYNTIDTRNRRC